jgi:hypothetical protein
MRTTRWLTAAGLALALAGCTQGEREGMKAERAHDDSTGAGQATASTYTPDSAEREGTHMGAGLEAPARIGPMRQMIATIRTDPAQAGQNLTAYKNQVSDLVNSMQADLLRRGISADSADWRERSQRVVDALGGGTGPADPMTPTQMRAHADSLEALIAWYQRQVPEAGDTAARR